MIFHKFKNCLLLRSETFQKISEDLNTFGKIGKYFQKKSMNPKRFQKILKENSENRLSNFKKERTPGERVKVAPRACGTGP